MRICEDVTSPLGCVAVVGANVKIVPRNPKIKLVNFASRRQRRRDDEERVCVCVSPRRGQNLVRKSYTFYPVSNREMSHLAKV